jgi:hypothetical protein
MFSNLQSLFYGPLANIPKALLVIAYIWGIFWKGVGLWRSSKNNQKYWFIAIFILNTLGILEIVYLSFFQKTVKVKASKK